MPDAEGGQPRPAPLAAGTLPRRDRVRLRRRTRNLMRDLEVRPPLDVGVLCDRLGGQRGRVIVLESTGSMPMSVAYAMWAGDQEVDRLFIQSATSPTHWRHLVLHEIGHMIAGHELDPELELAGLLEDLPAAMIEAALRRHGGYSSHEEQEAEYIAGTILSWASDLEVLPVQSAAAAQTADRALSERRGWL